MYVLTREEMREVDRRAIEDLGIPGLVLMENAGRAVAQVCLQLLEELKATEPEVLVVAGKGNNGGDGLVAARHLFNQGVRVSVACLASPKALSADALTQYKICQKMGMEIQFLEKASDLEYLAQMEADLLIDALLGTGVKGPVTGLMAKAIEFINDELWADVVSVDIPSGLIADMGEVPGPAIEATATVTMAAPKRCHIFYPAKEYVGELFVADIGIPPDLMEQIGAPMQMVDSNLLLFPYRFPDAHKYSVGKVAVIAGSRGYTGAASLCAQAALKIGAGMVILAIPESLNPILETRLTEVITRPVPDNGRGVLGKDSLNLLRELLDWCDVLAIGPGVGREEETQFVVLELLKHFDKRAVIDADALFALAQHPDLLKKQVHPFWVLTPHLGEFHRFVPQVPRESLNAQRVELAQRFAREHHLHLLLKGAPSMLVCPDGRMHVNSSGNAALASAGTGDVLTGMIAGLLAQDKSFENATLLANYLHGFIADYYVKRYPLHCLTAQDLIDLMPMAIQEFQLKDREEE